MRTRLLFLGGLAAVALAAAGCRPHGPPAPLSAAAPVPVLVQADWYPQPEYGGFYQALARGFYREAGLDVKIQAGSFGTVPQQVVATGQADFGIGNSTDVIIAASRGIPLVLVGAYMERDPQGIMFHAGTGIHSFRDLDGRSIMASPGSPFIRVIEKIYGIHLGVTPTDFGLSRFMSNPSWIQQCFITNEPYYLRRQGVDVGVLLVTSSGFSPYRVFYTRQQFLLRRPDIVRAFAAATLRGWADYLEGNPAPAEALIAAGNPRMDPEFMAFARRTMQAERLVTGDPAAGEALGKLQPARLTRLIGQLKDVGLLSRPVTASSVWPESLSGAPRPASP